MNSEGTRRASLSHTAQADETWENEDKCETWGLLRGVCECCCKHGLEKCVTEEANCSGGEEAEAEAETEAEAEESTDESDFQAGFKFPVVKFVDPGSLDPGSLDPGSLNPGSLNPGSLDPGNSPNKPKQKELKLKYFKRKSKSKKTNSEKTCLDGDAETRKVGHQVLILPLSIFK